MPLAWTHYGDVCCRDASGSADARSAFILPGPQWVQAALLLCTQPLSFPPARTLEHLQAAGS